MGNGVLKRCCGCDELTGCNCGGNCGLQCRSKGGIATLVGFPEYVSPSVPPRSYRIRTLSGSTTIRASTSSDCSNPAEDEAVTTYSGACVFDRLTGDQTAWASISVDGGAGTPTCSLGFNPCFLQQSYTQTTRTQTGNGTTCCPNGFAYALIVDAGTRTEIQSDEDTEDDAIDRLMAPLNWTVVTCESASTFRTERGAGQFVFEIRKGQVRARVLTPLADRAYDVTIRFVERPLGVGGDFEFLGRILEVTVVTDSNPATEEWTDWFDIPEEAGLEIMAESCSAVLVPL